MSDSEALLTRISQALERFAPVAGPKQDWLAHPAYVWDRHGVRTNSRAPSGELRMPVDQLRRFHTSKATPTTMLSAP